jgi:hypothetical protein
VRALAFVLLLLAGACAPVYDFFRGYGSARTQALGAYDLPALSQETRGAVYFTLGDFGALDTDAMETHAVPWRLAGAALVLAEHEAMGAPLTVSTLRAVMQRFGFLYPTQIGNWPATVPPPELHGPLGLNIGRIERSVPRVDLMVANLGCASCHAGVSYDAEGLPRADAAWLGAPNTSLNLEAYVQAIYDAFAKYGADGPRLIEVAQAVFPDMRADEVATLKSFVLPRVKQRMARIAAQESAGPLPFVNGTAGVTNGVAALKMQFGLLGAGAQAQERGFTAIPDLGDRGLRAMLLYDGAYAPKGEGPIGPFTRADVTPAHLDRLGEVTAFFTVPSMGVHPGRVRAHLADARDVLHFVDTYASPRFPAPVDRARAREGQALYAARCASCHGAYDDSLERPRLQSFPNWMGDVGTDPARAQAFTPALRDKLNQSAYGEKIISRATGQYAAPPLSGLWMSAPYLHNGAVPSLEGVLDPSKRPASFRVGGHALDLATLGVSYPAGHTPFATPQTIDTTQAGFGNRGHETEVEGLSARERRALIEYLKLL